MATIRERQRPGSDERTADHAPDAARPRLRGIRAVTYVVPDLALAERTYVQWLGHRVVGRGTLPESTAAAWHAPAAAGAPVVTLAPASSEPVFLRFVEDRDAAPWRALTTHGWNVTEIVVEDVAALAERFELPGSPFTVVGPPASLQRFPMIRAMQAVGPLGECLYFTQVGAGSGLDLATARAPVGRVFIVVAGGPDLPALFRTYDAFGNDFDPPVATRVRVISWANDLPPETEHEHGLVKLGAGTLVELDRYPDVTRPRDVPPDRLPAGMALVTLDADRLPAGAARTRAFLPGFTPPCTTLRGGAGELIELVETNDA